jgi:DNA-binding response OmpR family regulator
MSAISTLNERLQHLRATSARTNSDLAESARQEVIAGDFRLEITARKAFLHARELPLTSEEFEVLHYLVSHRKMVVTPQTVLSTPCDAVRARPTDFLKSLLSLKKKLDEASGKKSCLHVEPWVLYEFDLNTTE